MCESTWFVLLCMAYGGGMSTKDFSLKIKGLRGLKVPIFLTFLEWIDGGFLNLKFLLDKG